MKIKLMIAVVIACLVFTGFTKENVSDTVDHNAWKTSGVVVIQNDVLTLAGSNARALLNDGKGYTNFELDMDVRTTTGGKGYIGIHTDATDRKGYRIALNNDREDPVWWRMTGMKLYISIVRWLGVSPEPDEEFRERERMVQDEYPGRRTAYPGAD